MSDHGQKTTKEVYENPEIVEGYIKEHSLQPKLPRQMLSEFADSLPGKSLLDLGCGPGHDSHTFAEMGCKVVGVDYSTQMIEAAKKFKPTPNPPQFVVGDMRNLSPQFSAGQFDGIWACASLLHIEKLDINSVVSQIHTILAFNGKAFIGLKGGETTAERIVSESKYGPKMEREFTLWTAEDFNQVLSRHNFTIDKYDQQTKANRQGASTTTWLNYWISKQ